MSHVVVIFHCQTQPQGSVNASMTMVVVYCFVGPEMSWVRADTCRSLFQTPVHTSLGSQETTSRGKGALDDGDGQPGTSTNLLDRGE